MLSAASKHWYGIFKHLRLWDDVSAAQRDVYMKEVNEHKSLQSIDLIIMDTLTTPDMIYITLTEDVQPEYFKFVLQFLYTGMIVVYEFY